jgi:periplasmic divalent cation tolerance protein
VASHDENGSDRYQDLEAFVIENHGYETPGILATAVTGGSQKYLTWVMNETRPPG